jgi:hypothetical protein
MAREKHASGKFYAEPVSSCSDLLIQSQESACHLFELRVDGVGHAGASGDIPVAAYINAARSSKTSASSQVPVVAWRGELPSGALTWWSRPCLQYVELSPRRERRGQIIVTSWAQRYCVYVLILIKIVHTVHELEGAIDFWSIINIKLL